MESTRAITMTFWFDGNLNQIEAIEYFRDLFENKYQVKLQHLYYTILDKTTNNYKLKTKGGKFSDKVYQGFKDALDQEKEKYEVAFGLSRNLENFESKALDIDIGIDYHRHDDFNELQILLDERWLEKIDPQHFILSICQFFEVQGCKINYGFVLLLDRSKLPGFYVRGAESENLNAFDLERIGQFLNSRDNHRNCIWDVFWGNIVNIEHTTHKSFQELTDYAGVENTFEIGSDLLWFNLRMPLSEYESSIELSEKKTFQKLLAFYKSELKFNFILKDPLSVDPFGNDNDLSVHWFALTDAQFWISYDNSRVFEYSEQAIEHFSMPTKYSEYYLARFVEDFTDLFKTISEVVPGDLADVAYQPWEFSKDLEKWYNSKLPEYKKDYEPLWDRFHQLKSWLSDRTLDSNHLRFGPQVTFTRHGEKIIVAWEIEHNFEKRTRFWSQINSNCELSYVEFCDSVRKFGDSFFEAMDKQVQAALTFDWGHIQLDKEALVEEHAQRKKQFNNALRNLEKSTQVTEWGEIRKAISEMRNDLKNIKPKQRGNTKN